MGAVSRDRFRFGLIAAAYGLAVFLFFRLPAVGFGGKRFPVWSWPWFRTSFTLPTAALAIVLIFKSLAKRDPLRSNYARFRRTYDLFLDLAVLLAILTHLLIISKLMILQGFGWPGPWIAYVPTTLIGLILVVFGNVMPRLRPNSAVGIRTRWTLRDEIVWTKTHRASGYLLVLFGLILIAWTFIDFQGIWWVLGPVVILTAAGLPLLSFIIWTRRRRLPSIPLEERTDKKEVSS